MKNKFLRVIACLMVVLMTLTAVPTGVFGDTALFSTKASAIKLGDSGKCGENVSYYLNNDGVLTISGTGDMYDYGYDEYGNYNLSPFDGNALIKSVVINNGVTSVGDEAFYCCKSLTSVLFSDSVTNINRAFDECGSLAYVEIGSGVVRIADYAFSDCDKLTSIDVKEDNEYYSSLDGVLFNKDKTELILYPRCKTNDLYTIPDSVISIKFHAFFACENLTNVIIPKGTDYIGYNAFAYCTNISSILIPDSVTYIGEYSFSGCRNLNNIIIGNGVTYIGEDAFSNCENLISVTIPGNVISVGDWAFSFCVSLSNLIIEDGITEIGEYAFSDCFNLRDVYYTGTKGQWNNISIGDNNECLTNATIHYNYDSSHIHNYVSTITKLATCTENGVMRFACSCGDSYTEPIPATGHKEVAVKGKPATCTENGLTDGVKCSVCDEIIKAQEVIKATGHKEETIKGTPVTCTKDGLTDGTKCSVCSEIIKAQEVIKATGHKEETIKGTPATCTNDGLLEGTKCSVCGEIIKAQEVIKATGHKEETIKGTPATCTKDGLTDGTKCSVCGEIIKSQEVIKATGHKKKTFKGTPATCTKDGLTDGTKCSVCGEVIKAQEVIKSTGHKTVTDKAVAATCTKNGKTAGSHCSVCGTVIKAQTTVKATGHTYGAWKTTKKATYTAIGTQTRVCTACGAKQTKTIAKLATTSVTKCTITTAKSAVYTGRAIAPKIAVKNGKTTLKSGTHYTVSYKNNTKIGKATVTIKGDEKNGYIGTKTLTFNILPGVTKSLKATQSTSAIKLTWSKVAGATGYRVFRYDTKSKKWVKLADTKNTTYTVSKLKAGTNYKYAVKAYTTVGKTVYWSASYAQISTATKPATPTVKVSAGKKQAALSWKKISGASGYVVYYNTSKNGTYKKLATTKSNSYTAKKLTTGKTYYFKVAAYKTVGKANIYGAYSAVNGVKVK